MESRRADRRTFLKVAGWTAVVALTVRPAALMAEGPTRVIRRDHPTPRPEADGSQVLARTDVPPHVADLFDQVREIPHVVDGIRCSCGCAEIPGMYSLLSCYEGAGMAQYCTICQGEGQLAYRLHSEGRSLTEIRAEIDRRFG